MFRFLEKRKVLLVYTPLVIYWSILLTTTSWPSITLPNTNITDKEYHLSGYFVLGILLNLTLIFQSKYPLLKKMHLLFTLLIGSFYGIFDEVHQHFIPGRSMEFLDFVADFSGLVLAVLFVLFLMKLFNFTTE